MLRTRYAFLFFTYTSEALDVVGPLYVLTDSALSKTLLSFASKGRSLAVYGLPAKARNSGKLTVPSPLQSKRLVAKPACSLDMPSNTPSCLSPSSKSAVEILPVPFCSIRTVEFAEASIPRREGGGGSSRFCVPLLSLRTYLMTTKPFILVLKRSWLGCSLIHSVHTSLIRCLQSDSPVVCWFRAQSSRRPKVTALS